ncbi:MAG: hypothetical protein ACPG1C_00980 [Alphaproteobacteria bacterium]
MPRPSHARITCSVTAFCLGLIIAPLTPLKAHAETEIAKPQAPSKAKKIYIGDINVTENSATDETTAVERIQADERAQDYTGSESEGKASGARHAK